VREKENTAVLAFGPRQINKGRACMCADNDSDFAGSQARQASLPALIEYL
jgi:hypothetical protein